MAFPYGSAPLALPLNALVSGIGLHLSATGGRADRPDLVFGTFTRSTPPATGAFEREDGVRVHLQVVDQRALQGRLQSSLQVGADVPDMVELLDGTMGIVTKGPIEDVPHLRPAARRAPGRARVPAGLGRAAGHRRVDADAVGRVLPGLAGKS
jgi:hypothetical protein